MKSNLTSRIRASTLAAALGALLFVTGCITHQVRQAIGESDLAAISAELNLGNENPAKPSGTGWKDASARIETFIAAHPENPSTIAALRVRQAMMLLDNRQYSLAKAAFDEVKPANLHTHRDQAVKELEEELRWWYQTAPGSVAAREYPTAAKYLARITKVRTRLMAPQDEGMRDWLAALRAWIGLKLANDADKTQPGVSDPRTYFEDALNTYAAMLPAGDTGKWLADTNFPAELEPRLALTGSNRRRFQANDLIEGARKAIRANAITNPLPVLTDPYFKERLAR